MIFMKKMQFGDRVTIQKDEWIPKEYHKKHGIVTEIRSQKIDHSVVTIANISFKLLKSKWISIEKLIKGWK